ncbi:hypothetical protein GO495_29340 [Chitinophaga oryziterrae]|uniref:DUF4412 domain-containing protein n=2 Tax=Chitinophaga oryziterrae TaxID=1031224 RepID=A0A6N8JID5_9BACT|nr:hypothetical protein [Chitinophaga oryziterrae]
MMKRVTCLLIFSLFFLHGYSQAPVVKQGTTLKYIFSLHGQTVPIEFSVLHLTDTLVLGWKIRGLAGGTYIMVPAALQHAVKMNFIQPSPDVAINLKDDETFMIISTDAFRKLEKEHAFVYDNTVYNLKEREGNMLHVTAKDETTEWWILNNPDFPLVCRIKGSPFGIDCSLNDVK